MLGLIVVLKTQFIKFNFIKVITGRNQTIMIKNRTYLFYNDIINLKNFKSNLLKIEKQHYKELIFTT